MPPAAKTDSVEISRSPDEQQRQRRQAYEGAFPDFVAGLTSDERRAVNGSGRPDWQGTRTFALPVVSDNPAYRTEDSDGIVETLEELLEIDGAQAKIACWLNDRFSAGPLSVILPMEQFRTAIARICEAKNPRLEATLVGLAIRMNLSGNANGFSISSHFGLTPQTFHECLAATCAALGVEKPLSKINKERYKNTQHRHSIRRTSP
jgi:hypothetical protein